MNRNRMLVLAVVALLLSGGVTYLAYRVIQTRLQPTAVTSKIVVAAKKMDLGYRITKDDVKLIEWPTSMPLENSFSELDKVIDRGTIAPLQVNEPILESKLAPREAGAGLMTVIPPGMRAVAIQVNSIIGVAGFVQPGSRVDLIFTAVPPKDVKGAKGDEMGSKIVLENLEVIAVGQNVQRNVDGKPQTVQEVTVLVTPDQAQRVALATDGKIQLALRNPMDKDAAEPSLVVKTDLYNGPTMETLKDGSKKDEPPEKPEPKGNAGAKRASRPAVAAKPRTKPPVMAAPLPPPPPQRIVVEVIQGSKRSENTFEEEGKEATEAKDDSTQSNREIQ